MKKLILLLTIIVFISLASAIEEKNIKFEIQGVPVLGTEYLPEYDENIGVPADFLVYSLVYQKTTQETSNSFDYNEILEENGYYLTAKLYKNGVEIKKVLVPLFGFSEDISNDTKIISFIVPYSDADKIIIFYKNNLKYQIKIDKKTCNSNNVCENNEDAFSCSDCSAGNVDEVCVLSLTDGICDPDCGIYDYDCNSAQLCSNKLIDMEEEFFDCGGVCDNTCAYDDASLDKLIQKYDQGKFDLLGVNGFLGGKFGYSVLYNV